MTTNSGKKPVQYLIRIVYLLCLALLLGLGGWQIDRGLEKNRLEKTLTEQQHQSIVIKRKPQSWDDIKYKKVELDGNWLAGKTFLLDNRIYQGRLGYEVLHPFQLSDGSVMLVNLGWIDKNRIEKKGVGDVVPADSVKSEKVSGQLYLPKKGFTLGAAYTNETSWPKIIQYFDRRALSKALGVNLQPAVIVQESNPNRGLTRIWSPYVINPLRHFGYAVQWWGLALLLIIFGFIWSRNNSQ